MRRARGRGWSGLFVAVLAMPAAAWGQVGVRPPVMPPPVMPPPFAPPRIIPVPIPGLPTPPRPPSPPSPPVAPEKAAASNALTLPLHPPASAQPAAVAAAPLAPAAPPTPVESIPIRWFVLLLGGGAVAGACLALFIQGLRKLYPARVKQVRIVATPYGEAPEDVRGAWVGLTLPLAPNVPAPYRAETVGVVSGRSEPIDAGYLVNGRQAVEILATKAPWAAAWWREHAPHVLVDEYQLLFPSEACEPV